MDRPLKILHLLSYHLYTGPAEPVLRLARAQREAGHTVALAFDTLRRGDLAERAAEFGVPLDERFGLSVKAGAIVNMRDLLALKRLWREGEVDVLHCHRSHDHTLAALARTPASPTRLVRTLFSERSMGPKRSWQLRRADGLITVARRYRDELLERGLLDADRILAVEGVVDPHVFRPGKGGDRVRAEAGIAAAAPVAGIVARVKPGRGHDLLLDAWAEVQRRLPEARLIIAGRGELHDAVQARAQAADWGESVAFIGYRTDLPEVYRALDLMVLLAPGNDGTCRAALEAMASAKPVLAARRGVLAEMIEDGRTGRLVAPDDAQALADALVELLGDRDRLAAMGRAARHEATRANAIDRQADAVEALYRRLLAAGRRPSVD